MAKQQGTKTLMLRGVPPRLKGRIAKRVEQHGTNMNDILVGLLAEHYEIPFTPTGARRLRIGASAQINLTVPEELKEAIERDAFEQRTTERNIAVKIICEEFNQPFRPTGRWPVAA